MNQGNFKKSWKTKSDEKISLSYFSLKKKESRSYIKQIK